MIIACAYPTSLFEFSNASPSSSYEAMIFQLAVKWKEKQTKSWQSLCDLPKLTKLFNLIVFLFNPIIKAIINSQNETTSPSLELP